VASAISRPTAIQRVGRRCSAFLDPARAADHVLRDEGDGHHQPGDEAAAGLVVAAHEQVEGEQPGHRQQQPHQHGRHLQVGRQVVVAVAVAVDQVGAGGVGGRRAAGASARSPPRRAEAPQQRIHRQPDDAQHGDLAERVEGAEVDQHHVDHVGAAALGQGLLEEEGRDRQRRMARQQRVRQRRQADADGQPPARGRAAAATRCGRGARIVLLPRLGIQRRPSRNSTSVTTSTASCVSARSGAENQAKVMHSARPTTLSMRQRRQAVELGLVGGADARRRRR
jgi:hypothetical protein